MKKLKKISILFLTVVLWLAAVIPVSAATYTQDGIEITINTDKQKYDTNEKIRATVTVKNTNNWAVNDVSVECVIPDGYRLEGNAALTVPVLEGYGGTATQSVVFVPKMSNVPVTADSNQAGIWSILLLLGVAVLTGVCVLSRKRGGGIFCMLLCAAVILASFSMNAMEVKAADDTHTASVSATIQVGKGKLSIEGKVTYTIPGSEESGETESPAPSETESPAPSETESPAPSETESPAPSETESPAPSETESPAPSETESPAPSETESPAPSETESPAPSETESPAPSETESPAPSETESPAPSETESPAPSETESPAPSETESPAPTETPGPGEGDVSGGDGASEYTAISLGIPTKASYNTQFINARNPWDMIIEGDKLYIGSGDWDSSAGPIHMWYYDILNKKWIYPGYINEDAVQRFIRIGDQLIIPGIDPKDSTALGNYYTLENGAWVKHRIVPKAVHLLDIVEYGGARFYGIGTSSNSSDSSVKVTRDNDATFENVSFIKNGEDLIGKYKLFRTYDFFVLNEELYCTCVYGTTSWQPAEIFKYEDGAFRYVCVSGLNKGSTNNRQIYIYEKVYLNGVCYYANGTLKKTTDLQTINTLTMPDLSQVEDLLVEYNEASNKEEMYVLTKKKEGTVYKNTIWKYIDDENFEEICSVESAVGAMSFAKYGEDFVVGLGESLGSSTTNAPSNIGEIIYMDSSADGSFELTPDQPSNPGGTGDGEEGKDPAQEFTSPALIVEAEDLLAELPFEMYYANHGKPNQEAAIQVLESENASGGKYLWLRGTSTGAKGLTGGDKDAVADGQPDEPDHCLYPEGTELYPNDTLSRLQTIPKPTASEIHLEKKCEEGKMLYVWVRVAFGKADNSYKFYYSINGEGYVKDNEGTLEYNFVYNPGYTYDFQWLKVPVTQEQVDQAAKTEEGKLTVDLYHYNQKISVDKIIITEDANFEPVEKDDLPADVTVDGSDSDEEEDLYPALITEAEDLLAELPFEMYYANHGKPNQEAAIQVLESENASGGKYLWLRGTSTGAKGLTGGDKDAVADGQPDEPDHCLYPEGTELYPNDTLSRLQTIPKPTASEIHLEKKCEEGKMLYVWVRVAFGKADNSYKFYYSINGEGYVKDNEGTLEYNFVYNPGYTYDFQWLKVPVTQEQVDQAAKTEEGKLTVDLYHYNQKISVDKIIITKDANFEPVEKDDLPADVAKS